MDSPLPSVLGWLRGGNEGTRFANFGPDRVPICQTFTCGSAGDLLCLLFDHDGSCFILSPADFAFDVAKQHEDPPLNGPSCGAACTPPLSGPIGLGFEILGKAICDGPAC